MTRNTEYHVRSGRVVAVRPRGSSTWLERHDALDLEIQGHVDPGGTIPLPGPPGPGQRLYLARSGKERDVVTSPVSSVERPTKDIVSEYPPEAEAA